MMLKAAVKSRCVCNWMTILGVLSVTCAAQPASTAAGLDRAQVAAIHAHISAEWDVLTRSMTDCKTVTDPKMPTASVLYLPAEYNVPPAVEKAQHDCHIQLKRLSAQIQGPGEVDTTKFDPH